MRRLALCCALGLAASCTGPSPIRMLEEQQRAWNEGDVDRFFSTGYWESPYLTFYSGGERHYGYEAVLQRYRDRYGASRESMGELTFSDMDTEYLGRDHAMVRGRWRLAFADGNATEGLFTLVLLYQDDEWRIMHDHSSTARQD